MSNTLVIIIYLIPLVAGLVVIIYEELKKNGKLD